ncbi:MAG: flagellar type III secretion system pore protein FliP [Planctomycetes bacterium]|nr:flagellar type III secretion system pore protein FliP [Planctomycetota bacterium]
MHKSVPRKTRSKTSRGQAAVARWRGSPSRRGLAWGAILLAGLAVLSPAAAQDVPPGPQSLSYESPKSQSPESQSPSYESAANEALTMEVPEGLAGGLEKWTSPEGLSSTLQVMLLLTVLSMAPAVLLMTTCFVRIVVVLALLRQAIGTQQLPPSQVITSLSLFLTLLLMTPVWKDVYEGGIKPYTEEQISLEEAWTRGAEPIRRFMSQQIDRTGNQDDVYLFLRYLPDQPEPTTYDDVPLQALLPAFMLSELKTAFLIGFQIYLPFLILDMVIASVMVSMGMLMLPPVLISLPFKLLLFVLVDGWHLVVGMLMESFAPYT